MRVPDGFVICEVAGKTVAVSSGELAKTFNGMITLNGTGKFLFERLQNDISFDDLVSALQKEYGVDEMIARRDTQAFVDALAKKGLLLQ